MRHLPLSAADRLNRVTAARLAKPVSGTFLDQLSDADQMDLLRLGPVVRALKSLRSRGLVTTSRRRITIHDLRRLADRVDDAAWNAS